MHKTTRRASAGAALLVGALTATLALTGPAAAQPAPAPAAAAAPQAAPPSPEALALATEIARGYLASAQTQMAEQKVDLADYPIFQTAPFNTPALADRWGAWIEITKQVVLQTVADRKPQLESLLARTLAAHLSIEELRAGAQFMRGPGGPYAARVFAHEQPTPALPDNLTSTTSPFGPAMVSTINAVVAKAHRPLPPAADAALAKLRQSEAGRALLKDLSAGATWADAKSEYFEIVLPPMMIHLADAMEADQAKRDAAAKDAPSPEALALGVSIVHGGYAAVDDNAWTQLNAFMTIIAARMPPDKFGATGLPPKWAPLMLTGMVDTLRSDQPVMEQSIGRALARLCTPDDLKILAEFMNGPAPAFFVKKAMTGFGGAKDETPPPPEVQAAMDKFAKSGVMERLQARMQDKDKDKLIAIAVDASIPIVARFMRRFGEKAEAAEAPHAAGAGR
jgi:hypothetical protein